jgi:Myb-like DNA-binding domain
MATTIGTHTSTFSFTAPFPSSSATKQRRVSLATPASEREVPAFKFRDDTGLPSPSEERRGKVRRLTSPAPPEKKARKKWTMEETQMLVEGCNRVGLLLLSSLLHLVGYRVLTFSFRFSQHGVGNWKAILNDPTLHFDNRSPVDLKDRYVSFTRAISAPLLMIPLPPLQFPYLLPRRVQATLPKRKDPPLFKSTLGLTGWHIHL